MDRLARLALKLLSAASTVFIAACYGIRNGPLTPRAGTVVDATSSAPLPGILVYCLGNSGGTLDQDVTDPQGEFAMRPDCVSYRAEDIDGAENGAYATTTASFAEGETVVVRMPPVVP